MKQKRNKQPKFYICVHPIGSKFAKALQQALQNKVDHKVLRTRRHRVDGFVVTTNPLNKIEQFQRFSVSKTNCPPWTTDPSKVGELGGKTCFARTLINSTNGRGIIEFSVENQTPPRAPLYVAYIPKRAEYRVHVFHGEVIDIQQKRKKRGFEEERNTRVRNVDNGYVYCRDGINPPDGITDLAVSAVNACGYEYGAVDIIYNEKRNQCYVLEVNSRPGLMGTTLDKYVNAIIKSYELKEKE